LELSSAKILSRPTQRSIREIQEEPRFNLSGELVGINTAFVGAANTNPGMGFAISINIVRSVADQVMKNGEASRNQLIF
jgi:S1-C subfamily serine protease